MYPTNRFLNIVQALESYHRIRFGEFVRPLEENEEKINEIIDAIPEGQLNKKKRKRLKSAMRAQNRKNLSERLKELYEFGSNVLNPMVDDRNVFVDRIVVNRNYFTHWDENKKEGGGRQF